MVAVLEGGNGPRRQINMHVINRIITCIIARKTETSDGAHNAGQVSPGGNTFPAALAATAAKPAQQRKNSIE
jgi:hypothetical protein